jgi:site-specific DNA-methyltransferase (adenine-specific)
MVNRDKVKKSKIYNSSDSAPVKYNDGLERTYTQLYPKSIITESNASQKDKLHPTQKPVALLEYLIKTYSLENDLILDNCAGSGSTLVAAKNLNRRFLGFENNLEYYNIACGRIGQTF